MDTLDVGSAEGWRGIGLRSELRFFAVDGTLPRMGQVLLALWRFMLEALQEFFDIARHGDLSRQLGICCQGDVQIFNWFINSCVRGIELVTSGVSKEIHFWIRNPRSFPSWYSYEVPLNDMTPVASGGGPSYSGSAQHARKSASLAQHWYGLNPQPNSYFRVLLIKRGRKAALSLQVEC